MCYQVCVSTVSHCLSMGGKHTEATHLTLLKDCASICKLSENFMLRNSLHAKHIAKECAEICEACAEDCEKLDLKDEQMQECARNVQRLAANAPPRAKKCN